jgi:hypothetical protein
MKTIPIILINLILYLNISAQIQVGQLPHSCAVSICTQGSGQETDSIDVNNDGIYDIRFVVNAAIGADSYANTSVEVSHQDIEFAYDQIYIAKKFEINDLISDQLAMQSGSFQLRGIIYAFYNTGSGNWRDTSQSAEISDINMISGYVGFRLKLTNDTLYGWVHVNSQVTSMFQAILTADSYGIEDLTNVNDRLGDNLNEITVFPNPVSDILFIGNLNKSKEYLSEIFDVTGKQIYSGVIINNRISFTEYQEGEYVVRISDLDKSFNYKIFKTVK